MFIKLKVKHCNLEYVRDENSYNIILGNLTIEDFRSSLTKKPPTQTNVDEFNRNNSMKTGKELKLEYMENDVTILEHCFNPFVKLDKDIFKLNPLHCISLPCFSFDCFQKLSEVELGTIQDEEMVKDFISAIRGGICGVMGNRYINSQSQEQSQSQSQSQSPIHSQCQSQSQSQSQV